MAQPTPAADDARLLDAVHLSGQTQGADQIHQSVALFHCCQSHSGQTSALEDDGDGALLTVITADGQRNTLALFINTEDDELARLCFASNVRCLNLQQSDLRTKDFFFYDTKHNLKFSSSQIFSYIRPLTGTGPVRI